MRWTDVQEKSTALALGWPTPLRSTWNFKGPSVWSKFSIFVLYCAPTLTIEKKWKQALYCMYVCTSNLVVNDGAGLVVRTPYTDPLGQTDHLERWETATSNQEWSNKKDLNRSIYWHYSRKKPKHFRELQLYGKSEEVGSIFKLFLMELHIKLNVWNDQEDWREGTMSAKHEKKLTKNKRLGMKQNCPTEWEKLKYHCFFMCALSWRWSNPHPLPGFLCLG